MSENQAESDPDRANYTSDSRVLVSSGRWNGQNRKVICAKWWFRRLLSRSKQSILALSCNTLLSNSTNYGISVREGITSKGLLQLSFHPQWPLDTDQDNLKTPLTKALPWQASWKLAWPKYIATSLASSITKASTGAWWKPAWPILPNSPNHWRVICWLLTQIQCNYCLLTFCSAGCALSTLTTIGWGRVCWKRYQLLKSLKICTNVLPTCSPTPTWP